ncbi:hypothetical protein CTM97_12760 [Photobacterium phosphoreum]|uniref:Uncharacterized protein n=1 Tax=Photobacterium phosphoreum TaxID=659 RepID=A0A2T3JYJ4_PHOPO|nr:hypothetical protein CTM96_02275 [Photobacterium phosphoreum]PSU41673.1 hypothetical protein CTM97_12760 [Photobacterium phosphoreum]PSU54471.1 hypothetical protein C9J18_01335 [Photobacterium phosphoreum]
MTLLLSSTVLSGCNSIKEAAGNMVLGEDLIQASKKLDVCDMSGLNTLENIAKNENNLRSSAALIALGANYAASGNTAKVNIIAKQLKAQAPNKTLDNIKKEIIKSGKTQQKNRIENGFPGNCH